LPRSPAEVHCFCKFYMNLASRTRMSATAHHLRRSHSVCRWHLAIWAFCGCVATAGLLWNYRQVMGRTALTEIAASPLAVVAVDRLPPPPAPQPELTKGVTVTASTVLSNPQRNDTPAFSPGNCAILVWLWWFMNLKVWTSPSAEVRDAYVMNFMSGLCRMLQLHLLLWMCSRASLISPL